MVTVLSNCRRPHSGLDVLRLKGVTWCQSLVGCQNVQCPLRSSLAGSTAAHRRFSMVRCDIFCNSFCKSKNRYYMLELYENVSKLYVLYVCMYV